MPGVPSTPPWKYDLSYVDPLARRDYIADRTNKAVTVIDVDKLVTTAQIKGFAGQLAKNEISGPNSPVPISGTNVMYVSDGAHKVQVVDTAALAIVKTIFVPPVVAADLPNRIDEGNYDPVDKVVFFNIDNDTVAETVFIDADPTSATYQTVIARIQFPNATGGTGSTFYDPGTKRVYVELPSTVANPGGEIDGITASSIRTGAPVNAVQYATPNCNGAGMDVNPSKSQAAIGCDPSPGLPLITLIMNLVTGDIIQTLPQVGGADQVWYDKGANRYYIAARNMTQSGFANANGPKTPVLGVIDAGSNTWLENVATGAGSHSVAADPVTKRVFVPVPTGVAVYGSPSGP